MKKIKQKLKSFDIFGYQIGLNFDKNEGCKFQTILGGISTISVTIIISIFAIVSI